MWLFLKTNDFFSIFKNVLYHKSYYNNSLIWMNNINLVSKISQEIISFCTSMTDFCIEKLSSMQKTQPNPVLVEKSQKKKQQAQQIVREKPKKKRQNRRKNIQTKPQYVQMKPRAPTSSFLMYLQQKKKDFLIKHNTKNVANITKFAAQEWKKLPDKEKETYGARAEIEKQRYREQMKAYDLELSQDDRNKQMRWKSIARINSIAQTNNLAVDQQPQVKVKMPLSLSPMYPFSIFMMPLFAERIFHVLCQLKTRNDRKILNFSNLLIFIAQIVKVST